MKDFIKKNYLSVSDREIAKMFDVSVGAVSVARRRMGLKKSKELAKELRDARRFEEDRGLGVPDFSRFWGGQM